MKTSSFASQLAVGLGCLAGHSAAFATPENLAELAQRDGLSLDNLLTGLTGLGQKNTASDALTVPIQGKPVVDAT
jgi:hypothetical protein